jgi:Na+-transporting methylmalonyl-CoA/oxaloacetate decarboxylase gamma subunit
MKKIAAILLFLFTLVQAGPAISTLFADEAVVFIVDEDKNGDKAEIEKKEKKEYAATALIINELSQKINTAFHLAEKIYASPCLEKLTPPPNFC